MVNQVGNSPDIKDEKLLLELENIVHDTIMAFFREKFGSNIVSRSDYSFTHIFPKHFPNDIQGVSGTVQVVYKGKNYFIRLPEKYYKMQGHLNSIDGGKSLLAKVLSRLKHPSPKNRRGKVKKVVSGVANKFGRAMRLSKDTK